MDMQDVKNKMLNTKVIIRSRSSGVHYGTLLAWSGDEVYLKDSRRLWRWSTGGTGISLSEIAIAGIDQKNSKVTAVLPELVVLGICEIIPAHGMAIATIEGADTQNNGDTYEKRDTERGRGDHAAGYAEAHQTQSRHHGNGRAAQQFGGTERHRDTTISGHCPALHWRW